MSDIVPYRPAAEGRGVAESEPTPPTGPNADVIDIAALVSAFRRCLRLFFSVVAGIFVLSILVTLEMKPVYTATARVAINTQPTNVAPASVTGTANAPVVSSIPNDSGAIDTE